MKTVTRDAGQVAQREVLIFRGQLQRGLRDAARYHSEAVFSIHTTHESRLETYMKSAGAALDALKYANKADESSGLGLKNMGTVIDTVHKLASQAISSSLNAAIIASSDLHDYEKAKDAVNVALSATVEARFVPKEKSEVRRQRRLYALDESINAAIRRSTASRLEVGLLRK